MLKEENFIPKDFCLPNHQNELYDAAEAIENIKKEIIKTVIDDETHEILYDKTINFLASV